MENTMRLQSVGLVKGTKAENIKVGDKLMWNFGSVSVVEDIIKETPKTITVLERYKESNLGNSTKLYERKMSKYRLVCII